MKQAKKWPLKKYIKTRDIKIESYKLWRVFHIPMWLILDMLFIHRVISKTRFILMLWWIMFLKLFLEYLNTIISWNRQFLLFWLKFMHISVLELLHIFTRKVFAIEISSLKTCWCIRIHMSSIYVILDQQRNFRQERRMLAIFVAGTIGLQSWYLVQLIMEIALICGLLDASLANFFWGNRCSQEILVSINLLRSLKF